MKMLWEVFNRLGFPCCWFNTIKAKGHLNL